MSHRYIPCVLCSFMEVIFYIEKLNERMEHSYNGTVCFVKQDGESYRLQMITLTEKLKNLKYELLIAYLDRDIRISRHL